MFTRQVLAVVLAAGSLTWLAPAGEPIVSADERTLQHAGLRFDTPALLDYFRRRTPDEAKLATLQQRAHQLGSNSYAARLKATEELIESGRAALPALRGMLKNRDAETVRRAQHCIQVIEQNTRLGLSATASRVLADRQAAGAVETLLAYLAFVDEAWVEDEIRGSLKRLALAQGRAVTAVEAALEDAEPRRRAAAAWIVGHSTDARQRRRALPRLNDDSSKVRFFAASALLMAHEPAAVPALIGLLADDHLELAWRSEDLLARLAGDAAPTVWLDSDNNGRKVADAWQAWWKQHESSIDWNSIRLAEQSLGLTLVVENQRADGGRIYECNNAGQVRWQVRVANPIDAQWLPSGRVLVADSRSNQVCEMDLRGQIDWKYTGVNPTSCQRLPNGNTVISTYQDIIEVTRDHRVVFTYKTQGHTYHARKLPDGHYVWIDACGEIGEIDEQGSLIAKIKVSTGLAWGSIEKQRNGRYLVALGGVGKVQEIDRTGKVHWEREVPNPNRVTRLANGHLLIASHADQCIYELDAQGKELWKHPCHGRPFTALRR